MSITISGTGAITGVSTNYSFDKSLSIGGTVTYEDVTNVDSVGIITARTGVRVTGGDILLTGADQRKISFAGDGSAHYFKMDDTLNGPIINGFGGIALETNGTERLRIDSTGRVGVGTTSFNDAAEVMRVQAASGQDNTLFTIKARSTTGYCALNFGDDDFNEGRIIYQHSDNSMRFRTNDTEVLKIDTQGNVTKPTNVALRVNAGSTYGSAGSLCASPNPEVAILQSTVMHERGTTSYATTGSNAYTFVCPTDGLYMVHAHLSLNDVSQSNVLDPGNRIIFSMGYTLGGGSLPLSNYVEVIDTNEFDYQNLSYANVWYFTSGTRIAMGMNGISGSQSAYNLEWGIILLQ